MKATGKIIKEKKSLLTHKRWKPEKPSRYPPIHDQIDTPTDFSMAVWKQQQRRDGSRSQKEAEQR